MYARSACQSLLDISHLHIPNEQRKEDETENGNNNGK